MEINKENIREVVHELVHEQEEADDAEAEAKEEKAIKHKLIFKNGLEVSIGNTSISLSSDKESMRNLVSFALELKKEFFDNFDKKKDGSYIS